MRKLKRKRRLIIILLARVVVMTLFYFFREAFSDSIKEEINSRFRQYAKVSDT